MKRLVESQTREEMNLKIAKRKVFSHWYGSFSHIEIRRKSEVKIADVVHGADKLMMNVRNSSGYDKIIELQFNMLLKNKRCYQIRFTWDHKADATDRLRSFGWIYPVIMSKVFLMSTYQTTSRKSPGQFVSWQLFYSQTHTWSTQSCRTH